MPANRDHIPTPEKAKIWSHLAHLQKDLMPLADCEVGLLIGYDCSEALIPTEVVPPIRDGPFAQKTDLGWGIVGIVQHPCITRHAGERIGTSHTAVTYYVSDSDDRNLSHHSAFVFRNSVKVLHPLQILEQDFADLRPNDQALSHEDKKFLSIMEQGTHQCLDGHYEMPLPFRDKESMCLPNNRPLAEQRLRKLKRRLETDSAYEAQYSHFMANLVGSKHAERVPEDELWQEYVWYLPHHGVYHSKKPNKLRVVFDASCHYQDACLNERLLQGPDLTNSLLGVLLRFRQEQIAFMCDVEQMFHQFRVAQEHRNYFRYLWWAEGYSSESVDYRMMVHLFGAISSPSCANYGLKRIVEDYGHR